MRKSIIGLVFLFALQASAQDFKKSYSITPSPPPDLSRIVRGGPMPPPVQAPPAIGLDEVTNG